MEVHVEDSTELTRTVTVTVPADEVRQELNQDLARLKKRHRQRGFRPGKVPMSIIRKRFGAQVRSQVIDRLIRNTFQDAIEEQEDVVHVSSPELVSDASEIEDEGLTYRFEAERLPELDPVNYYGVEVERPRAEVTDEDIEAELAEIQQEHEYLEALDRDQVEAGDIIRLDFQILTIDGHEPTSERDFKGREIELGASQLLPGAVEEQIVGAAVGEGQTIEADYPEDFHQPDLAGARVEIAFEVLGIYQRVTPAIDDELAKDDGRAETIEELREIIAEELREELEDEAEEYAREQLLESLLEYNTFELPAGFLERQVDEEVRQRLSYMTGADPDEMDLESMGIDVDRLKESFRPEIEEQIRRSLLLEAISEKEEVEVDEEDVEERIEELIASQGGSAQAERQIRSHYGQRSNREMLKRSLRLSRTADLLLEEAVVEEIDWDDIEEEPGHELHDHDHDHIHDHDHDHDHDEHDHAERGDELHEPVGEEVEVDEKE